MGLFDKLLGTTPKATDPQAPTANPTPAAPPTGGSATPASAAPAPASAAPAPASDTAVTSGGLPPLGTPSTASAPVANSTAPASPGQPNAFQQADSLLGLTSSKSGSAPATDSLNTPSADPLASMTAPASGTPLATDSASASPLVPPLTDSTPGKDTSSTGLDMGLSSGSDVKVADSPALDSLAGMSSSASTSPTPNKEEVNKLVADMESKLAELKKALEK